MSTIARAYVAACIAEIDALKPGNVHRHAAGHGMTAADFAMSANVSAPYLTRSGASVGARVLEAVTATRAAVGQNTNLGILLLCAPLAAAAERGGPLRENLASVLRELDAADARAVYAAIAAADPGGLGRDAQNDVREPPRIGLRAAMAAAAERDLVARQYGNDFAEVFDFGLPVARRESVDAAEAVYLAFLTAHPDSHVGRKFGSAAAQALLVEARRAVGEFDGLAPAERRKAMLNWDRELKRRGLNPGATADLTVAALFAAFVS